MRGWGRGRGWWFRRERVTDEPAVSETTTHDSAEDRVVLLRALAKVPARQRTALILRYWEDLSLEDTARAMDCSVGTVKSQAARGLDKLRELVPPATSALYS
ncbi:RNA polymerase sigma factor (sigma-70 family) [Herbihabitans rhizosphaerae]|uniref:RNA polymerase sigma factor (Sigma-70 family) n=1 Tax=Herbihabitans rhizosphaerae TaxID=1872711 RepID=A0A4Q7L3X8_9PSEU|nr:RNA polymerase sigma factor (sigma-70 family) [Herbihabitans rhizosphaerae]